MKIELDIKFFMTTEEMMVKKERMKITPQITLVWSKNGYSQTI